MAYPSLLTIWDGAETSAAALDRAMHLASDGRHLDVLCLTTHFVPTTFYAADFSYDLGTNIYENALKKAQTLAEEAKTRLGATDIPHTVRHTSLTTAEMPASLGNAAWPYDLAILPKPYADGDSLQGEAVLDAILFNTTTPILMIPPGQEPKSPQRIIIAWNGSREALRAIRAALPILREASLVEIVMFDPPRHDADEPDAGRRLAEMLARHDVKLELVHLPQTTHSLADALMKRADEIGADLIVMGAYGHSRFRERVLGGATRDMLTAARLPVFMAH
ncbi:MAG: universal stress protein [Pseudomonadota bacterium]